MRNTILLRKIAGKLTACTGRSPLAGGSAALARPSLLDAAIAVFAVLLMPLLGLAALALAFMVDPTGALALATAPAATLDPAKIRDEILAAVKELRDENDARLKAVEAKGAADPLQDEKIERINNRISELEATKNRQGLGGGSNESTDPAKREYRKAFNRWMRSGETAGIREWGPKAALSVGTATAGQELVPDEFEKTLIDKLQDENVMRQLCTVVPSISGTKEIPVVATHGAAGWMTEAGAFTEADDTFGSATLGAHKIGRLIKVSDELMNDSAFDLESYIAGEFARSIAAGEETGFVAGTGAGQPSGIVGASQNGKTGVAGQTLSVTADDLVDLYHSLKRPYRKQATWLLADSSVKVIRKLKDSTGQYIWQPGLAVDKPDTIFNRPVEISDSVPAMAANARSIIFGALKYYWIADRVGFTLQRLNELYAANGQVGFRGYKRTDGKLVLAEAVKHYANSAT